MPVARLVGSPVSLLFSYVLHLPQSNIIVLSIAMLILVQRDLFYICATPRVVLLIVMSCLGLKQEWDMPSFSGCDVILGRAIVNGLHQESM